MRYFFSTGEASGELLAVLLAREIRLLDPRAEFEGIGGARMREAGFRVWRQHHGWASIGPVAAIRRIPSLLRTMHELAVHIRRTQPEIVVLVDFGAFNVRLAQRLRALRYEKPIVDVLPPSAWLDRERAARAVSRVAIPVTAFAHQRDFFRSLGLRIEYFGHPLAGEYRERHSRDPAPPDGGVIALLPGSRSEELRYHVPLLLNAFDRLREHRPKLRARFGAADARIAAALRGTLDRRSTDDVDVVIGGDAAVRDADAAFVASGTAVLESALIGTPCVAFYVVSAALEWYSRRVYRGRFVTIPNLVLGREVVPELLQRSATPRALATAMEKILRDPAPQLAEFRRLREALGPADALERLAQFTVETARRGC